jgi:hypothetical protein
MKAGVRDCNAMRCLYDVLPEHKGFLPTCTLASEVPTAMCVLSAAHATLVM